MVSGIDFVDPFPLAAGALAKRWEGLCGIRNSAMKRYDHGGHTVFNTKAPWTYESRLSTFQGALVLKMASLGETISLLCSALRKEWDSNPRYG